MKKQSFVNKIVFVILLILSASNTYAAWEGYPLLGSFRNSDSIKKLQEIWVNSFPMDRNFVIFIDIKAGSYDAITTYLSGLQYVAQSDDGNVLEGRGTRTLFVSIPMDQTDRVKALIDALHSLEAFEPAEIIAEIKTKIEEEAASLRQDVALMERNESLFGATPFLYPADDLTFLPIETKEVDIFKGSLYDIFSSGGD
jgi:hypothetical protein